MTVVSEEKLLDVTTDEGFVHRAWKRHHVGEHNGNPYDFWCVDVVAEYKLPDGRTRSTCAWLVTSMYEDEAVMELLWKDLDRKAKEDAIELYEES